MRRKDNPTNDIYRLHPKRSHVRVLAVFGWMMFSLPVEALTLDDLIAHAIQHDANRDAADYKLDIDESIRDVRASSLLPRLDLTATYTRLNEVELPDFDFGGGQAIENPFPQILDNYALKGTLAIPLMSYFKMIVPRMAQTKDQALISRASLEQQDERIAFTTRQLYYGLRMQQIQHEVFQKTLERVAKTQERMQTLFDAGQITRVELDGIKTQSAEIEQRLKAVERGVMTSKLQLSRFTGVAAENLADYLPQSSNIDASERLSNWVLKGETDALATAERSRPELEVLKQTLKMLEKEQTVAGRGALPDLNLVGQYEYSNPNQRIFPLTDEFNSTWSVGAQASWSPNDWIAANTLRKRAHAQVEEAKANLTALKRQVKQEVDEALAGYRNSVEAITVAEQKLGYERGRYAMTEQAIAAGTQSVFDGIDRENDVQQAELALIQAQVQSAIAEATLLRALGVTTETELEGAQ